jgi:hypothetical protein
MNYFLNELRLEINPKKLPAPHWTAITQGTSAFVVGALAPHASNKPLHNRYSPSNKNARAIQHRQVYDARLSMDKANKGFYSLFIFHFSFFILFDARFSMNKANNIRGSTTDTRNKRIFFRVSHS